MFERAPECKALGAGFLLQPSGMGVLRELGILADCLAHDPLGKALRRYQSRRWFALRYYQLATRWLTPWFQSDHEWITPARRVAFGIAQRIPWMRRQMALTMAGLVGSQEPKPS